MPRTIKTETEVFKYEELSDEAKEKARDWWRDLEQRSGDNYFAESVIEDATIIAGYLGFSISKRTVPLMSGKARQEPMIYWSGFWSQGDGACFEGWWYRRDMNKEKLLGYTSDKTIIGIAETLEAIPASHDVRAVINRPYGTHYSHSGTMFAEAEWDTLDDDSDGEYAPPEDLNETIKQAARDLADWIYHSLEKEYEWMMADEQVADAIIANEYEFTQDGKHYY